ncbi:MAG: calcineurin-like phosphoesterase family protein [Alistipes sp.]
MKKIYGAIILSLWCVCGFASDLTVQGHVRCRDRGVAGVWISDGERFAQTDKNGKYKLVADSDNPFVFVCVPSGYDAPVKEGVIRYFQPMPTAAQECDFTLLPRAGDDHRHGFIAIADPQIWAQKEFAKLAAAADDIAATVRTHAGRPFMGLCCGDIISGDHSFYGSYNAVMQRTGLDFHQAIGNHDMVVFGRSHETSFAKFEQMYGPTYYSFNVGRIHYVVLNDNFFIGRDYFYIGYLEERQLRWLEEDLTHVQTGSTVVVCMHIPSTCEPKDRKQFSYADAGSTLANHRGLYEILKPFRAHIITGHTHTTYNQSVTENLYEHVTPALSGAWWQGTLCTDGTPCGYGVYEVDGDQIRWQYKSTGYPTDYQMALYSGTQHPEFSGYAVANIWASDPAWRIEFFLDGKAGGQAERFETYDPRARQMYASTEHLDHKWIYPSISDHYYRVPLPEGTRHIEVVATDRFGRTSRAEISLNN